MYLMNRLSPRIFCILFALLWGFTASCSPLKTDNDLFYYRNETVRAEILLNCNGISSRFLYRGNASDCTVEFTAPEELNGFAIQLTENGGTVSIDGLSTDAPDTLCTVPKIIRTVFTLSPDGVTEIKTAPHPEKDGETVTAVTVEGITVMLDSSGDPILAVGILFGIPFTAQITDLQIEPNVKNS